MNKVDSCTTNFFRQNKTNMAH